MLKTKIIKPTKLIKKLNKLPLDTSRALRKTVSLEGIKLEGKLKFLIQRGGRTGRAYKRGNKFHVSSSPGEPPKTDTGRLVGSINYSDFLSGKEIGGVVGTRLRYGRDLEFGTYKLKPRPWLVPTFKEQKPKIIRAINIDIKKLLNGGVI